MSTKSFLFISAWIKPLKALPLQERWNVMEAIVEYATSGILSKPLNVMETVAFGFIRNEIDRMKSHRSETSERRRAAADNRRRKKQSAQNQPELKVGAEEHPDANACKSKRFDANACKRMHSDAPYDIISVSKSESVSESKSESDKKSSTTTSGVREGGNAGKKIRPAKKKSAKSCSRGKHPPDATTRQPPK